MSFRRSSVLSVGSRMTFAFVEEEPHYDDLSTEELRQTLEQTIRVNKTLTLENDIFERYLTRNSPQCLQAMAQILETAKHAQRVASQLAPISSVLSINGIMAGQNTFRAERSPSISSTHTLIGNRRLVPNSMPLSRGLKISLTHRIEMANTELEEMKKSLTDLEQLTVKTRINLKAQMEEIELRIQETHQVKMELEQNVIQKGVDPLTGKISAEKFVRFMEEWLKVVDSTIEKLRLKSATLKSQISRAKQQLSKRKDLGETLSAIDFEQITIENEDYVKKIEEKNNYFLELKRITGRYSLKLTNQKQKLNEQVLSLKNIKKDIVQKQRQIEKLQDERKVTKGEIEKANKQLTSIIRYMDEYALETGH